MFYVLRHRWLYEAITTLGGKQTPADLLAIRDELRRMGKLEAFGDMSYIYDLLNAPPTSVNASVYAGIVAEAAMRRRLLAASSKIAKAALDPEMPVEHVVTLAEAEVLATGSSRVGTVKPARRFMAEYIDAFMKDVLTTESPRVIKTGLTDLDRILGGLERGHQYMMAGATSMGKSSLALGMALDAARRQGKRVMVFSLEMSEEQLENRFISLMTNISTDSLKAQNRHRLTQDEQERVIRASAELSDCRLFLDCSAAIRPSDVRSRAARVYAEHGLDMVIIDHMHIMTPNNPTGKQVQDLGAIAMDLANIYKHLDVAGLTLAQLNRNVGTRQNKTPILADLRESGQIEENAYVVMFVHRPAYYDPETEQPNVAKVLVAKNRDGATGQVDVYWNPQIAAFKDLAFQSIEL
jgi:replicative DNA helicase